MKYGQHIYTFYVLQGGIEFNFLQLFVKYIRICITNGQMRINGNNLFYCVCTWKNKNCGTNNNNN